MIANKDLWEAFNSLTRLGEADLPPISIGFRLALNRNSLKPIVEAIETQRVKMVKDLELDKEESKADPVQHVANLAKFKDQWQSLLNEEVEWKSPATIEARKFTSNNVLKANDLGNLVAAGIIIGADLATLDELAKKM
jgi:hypothetical protein